MLELCTECYVLQTFFQPSVVRSQEPSSLQLATGVRFKSLPFYTVHGVLVPPTILGTQGAGRFQNRNFSAAILLFRFQEATLQFVLTCQQATDIASNRDISYGSKMEYPYQVTFRKDTEGLNFEQACRAFMLLNCSLQVQLRFCPRDVSSDQADEFPPSICVQVSTMYLQMGFINIMLHIL